MLPGVEPTRLPAPLASPPRAPSPAGRALVSVGSRGAVRRRLGVVLGLIGLNLLVLRTGRVIGALALVTVAVILSVARGLAAMSRRPPEPDDEVEVPQSSEPRLHDRVRAIARRSPRPSTPRTPS